MFKRNNAKCDETEYGIKVEHSKREMAGDKLEVPPLNTRQKCSSNIRSDLFNTSLVYSECRESAVIKVARGHVAMLILHKAILSHIVLRYLAEH